jgi:hypothetical protein
VGGVQTTLFPEAPMSRTRRLHRIALVLAVGLLLAAPAQAFASGHDSMSGRKADRATAAALAQERYDSNLGYTSSYGGPGGLTQPSSADGSGDPSWVHVALPLAAALMFVVAGAAGLYRVRTRRRSTARVTA